MRSARALSVTVAACFVVMGNAPGVLARDKDLAQAQLNLRLLGYDPGPVDGQMGGRTLAALEAFHVDHDSTFDGSLGVEDIDAIYQVLLATPYNAVAPLLDPADGKTDYDPAFDFVPERDLSAEYVPVAEINPNALADRLAGASSGLNVCGYFRDPGYPDPGERLHTYASLREFETVARRTPHPGNAWFEDLSWFAQRAAPSIAISGQADAVADMKEAFSAYAEAGTGLDSASLVDSSGKVIVVPDFATGHLVTTSLLANYVLAKPRLGLTEEEQTKIEGWLDRLYETFPDSYFAMAGSERDTLNVARYGNATMLHALMKDDVEEFNRGAHWALAAMSFVRPDGSERLGASRGNRALFYQGTALMHAMETYVILSSQGVPVTDLLYPTVSRMAEFWGRAWHDHSVLHPYARENNAVHAGSDYRTQEERDPSEGIDLFLSVGGDESFADLLRSARATYEFESQFGSAFNETCIAATIAE